MLSTKRPGPPTQQTGADKKRARMRDQRVIGVQGQAKLGGSAAQGNNNLPPTLEVEKFAEARVFEINSLQKAMRNAKAASTVRAFQSLPRALRRRAASHNIRRLPIRLRAKAATETPDGAAVPKKKTRSMMGDKLRMRKKYGRKATLLRRQVNKIWLETHIWHAKRMHMKTIWGHRLADKPTEKAYRSSYRASVNGALVHDASYLQYIELRGSESALRALFDQHFDPNAPSPCSKRYSTGARECHSHIFVSSSSPSTLLGPAALIWDASPVGENEPRRVLIRLHPAICIAAWNALSGTLAWQRDSGIGIRQLDKELLTFEITGRRATEVVKAVLKLTPACGEAVKEAWSKLSSAAGPGSVPMDMIFGLEVYDPRLSFPPKLDKSAPKVSAKGVLQPSCDIAESKSFWDRAKRGALKTPRFQKSELDARRSELLIPGSRLTATTHDDRIPLLLSQRTISSSPFSSLYGWTLILPSGWGVPFWSSLIFSGTRPGGLAARSQQSFEAGAARFPEDYPGTVAFDLYEAERALDDRAYWERRPPAKRPNYAKLGTANPFAARFGSILKRCSPEYASSSEPDRHAWVVSAKVVRELERGDEAAMGRQAKLLWAQRVASAAAKEKHTRDGTQIRAAECSYGTALVRVRITPCARGAPEELAVVYWLNQDQARDVVNKVNRLRKGTAIATGESERGDELCSPLPTTRDVIGRVTTGNFSLKVGHGAAVGAVPLAVYLDLVERDLRTKPTTPLLVAVRNRDGETFRAASLEVMP